MNQVGKEDTLHNMNGPDINWCLGCGNFKIIDSGKRGIWKREKKGCYGFNEACS